MQAYYDDPTNDSETGDEFVPPRTVGENPAKSRPSAGDSVLFYNYRGDRPRELVRAFMQPYFHGNVPPSPDPASAALIGATTSSCGSSA